MTWLLLYQAYLKPNCGVSLRRSDLGHLEKFKIRFLNDLSYFYMLELIFQWEIQGVA